MLSLEKIDFPTAGRAGVELLPHFRGAGGGGQPQALQVILVSERLCSW